MKVYVVMSNDYPESVFSTETAADTYCKAKNDADKAKHPHRMIFWKVYEFPLDARAV